MLSQRLRELEQTGIVSRVRLGPPARATAYELTDRGAALEPVLVQLGRWGRDQPLPEGGELSVDALVLALKTTFDPTLAADGRCELRIGDDVVTALVSDGVLVIRRGPDAAADATVSGSSAALRAVAFGRRAFDHAVEAGELVVTGDRQRARRFLDAFAGH